jgi:hypothetical protein
MCSFAAALLVNRTEHRFPGDVEVTAAAGSRLEVIVADDTAAVDARYDRHRRPGDEAVMVGAVARHAHAVERSDGRTGRIDRQVEERPIRAGVERSANVAWDLDRTNRTRLASRCGCGPPQIRGSVAQAINPKRIVLDGQDFGPVEPCFVGVACDGRCPDDRTGGRGRLLDQAAG